MNEILLFSIPFTNEFLGFTVAVLYCFLNAEVRNSLRYHIERWRNVRTLRHGDYPLPVNRTFSSRTLRGRKSEYRLRYTSSITRNPHHRCQSSYSSPPHLLITNQYNSKNVKNGSKVETQLIQSQSTNGTNKRNVFEEYL